MPSASLLNRGPCGKEPRVLEQTWEQVSLGLQGWLQDQGRCLSGLIPTSHPSQRALPSVLTICVILGKWIHLLAPETEPKV